MFLVFVAQLGFANEIQVNRPFVRAGESFEVTIRLEGKAADVSPLPIPLTNVQFVGDPSVYSEVRIVNRRFTRSKLLSYSARALGEGVAVVGPIVLQIDGREVRIPEARVEVLPAVQGERPGDALRRLDFEAQEGIVLTASTDRPSAILGEQIVVTWTVLASDSVTNVSVTDLPQLDGFWVEEIPVTDRNRRNRFIDGRFVTEAVIRKAALFPLRTGRLVVPPLEIRAGVLRSRDPFGLTPFGGSGVNAVIRSSQPLPIDVYPVPAEADLVGDFRISCSEPRAVPGGPVSVSVTLAGDGNLRGAEPPRFASPPDGEVEIEEGVVEVLRGGTRIRMERRWTYLILPASRGRFDVPPLVVRAFNPATGSLDRLRCGGGRVESEPAAPLQGARAVGTPVEEEELRAPFPVWTIAAGLVIAGGIAWLLLARRRERQEKLERRILDHADDPQRMKDETRALLREKGFDPEALYRADSGVGEAYRTLWSLLDVLEKEPWEREHSRDDLRRRVRTLARLL